MPCLMVACSLPAILPRKLLAPARLRRECSLRCLLANVKLDVSLQVAQVGDLVELRELARSYHSFEGVSCTGSDIGAAVSPLLGESVLGRCWLIRRGKETVGYVAICFGCSIEFGGRDPFVYEIYISEPSRSRAIGTEVLRRLKSESLVLGVKALHLGVSRDNKRARRLYEKSGLSTREQFILISARQACTVAQPIAAGAPELGR